MDYVSNLLKLLDSDPILNTSSLYKLVNTKLYRLVTEQKHDILCKIRVVIHESGMAESRNSDAQPLHHVIYVENVENKNARSSENDTLVGDCHAKGWSGIVSDSNEAAERG